MSKVNRNFDAQATEAAILSENLDYMRINDIKVKGSMFDIVGKDVPVANGGVESKLHLYDGKDYYKVTTKQLAAMRIAIGPLSDDTLAGYKVDPNGLTLQRFIQRERSKAKKESEKFSLDSCKFKMTGQLKMVDAITGKVILKNSCYVGHATYSEKMRAQFAGRKEGEAVSSDVQFEMVALRRTLHDSGVREGIDEKDVKNFELLPVFEVVYF